MHVDKSFFRALRNIVHVVDESQQRRFRARRKKRASNFVCSYAKYFAT